MHYKSFLTEEMVWDVMKDHAFMYDSKTCTDVLLDNESYIKCMMSKYGYTRDQVINSPFRKPQSNCAKSTIKYAIIAGINSGIVDATYDMIKQIEAVYLEKHINEHPIQKEEPKKVQEDLMYIPESTTGNVINMVAVEVPKKEEKKQEKVQNPKEEKKEVIVTPPSVKEEAKPEQVALAQQPQQQIPVWKTKPMFKTFIPALPPMGMKVKGMDANDPNAKGGMQVIHGLEKQNISNMNQQQVLTPMTDAVRNAMPINGLYWMNQYNISDFVINPVLSTYTINDPYWEVCTPKQEEPLLGALVKDAMNELKAQATHSVMRSVFVDWYFVDANYSRNAREFAYFIQYAAAQIFTKKEVLMNIMQYTNNPVFYAKAYNGDQHVIEFYCDTPKHHICLYRSVDNLEIHFRVIPQSEISDKYREDMAAYIEGVNFK